jgi:hypothetical protein
MTTRRSVRFAPIAVTVAAMAFVAEMYAAVTIRDPGVVENTGVMRYAAKAGSAGIRLARSFEIMRPVRPGVRVSQTFFMFDDGLSSVSLYPFVNTRSAGTVTIELWLRESDGQRAPRLDQGRRLVRREEVSIASLRSDAALTMTFTPESSVQRWFEIVAFVSDDVRGADFGLLATGGDAYERGTFRANDEPRAGDLMFSTSLHPRASIATFSERLGAAAIPHPAFVWIAALAVPNIVFAFVAVAFARRWDQWNQGTDASQASRI